MHFFSPGAHGTFTKVGHILCHKVNLIKFLKVEIIQIVFFNRNKFKPEIKKKKKSPNTWKLNNALLNNTQVKEEVSRAIKKKREHE